MIPKDEAIRYLFNIACRVGKLEAENAALKAKLEEERQENASLRSGDDYERGAE